MTRAITKMRLTFVEMVVPLVVPAIVMLWMTLATVITGVVVIPLAFAWAPLPF